MKCVLLVLACVVFPAWAQRPVTLDKITVTVQSVTREEQKLPLSDSVLSATDLDRLHITDISQAAAFVPNVRVTKIGGVNTLTIRGIGGGGRNIGIDPRVGVYRDGVYMGQAQALDSPWFDVEQSLFLSGPQGTAFGRNSISGAVALQSYEPTPYWSGRVKLEGGSRNLQTGEAVVSGPVSERWSMRAAVRGSSQDGDVWNQATHTRLNSTDSTIARVGAQWNGDSTTVKVGYDNSHVRSNALVGQPTTDFFGAPLLENLPVRQVAFNTNPLVDMRSEGGNATVEWRSGYGTLTSITAHRSLRQKRVNDTDYSAADLLNLYYKDTFSTTSQELRWNGTGETVDYQVGLYVATDTARTNRLIEIGTDTQTRVPVPGYAVRLPFGLAFGLKPGFGAQSMGDIDTTVAALFGNATVELTDAWSVDVGGRLSWEHKDLNAALDGSGSGALMLATFTDTDTLTTHDFSPRASVMYALSESSQAYVTYSTGYKSGGWNVDFVNVQQAQGDLKFRKETVDSWEAGVKSSGQNWSSAFAVFYATYDDLQVSQFVKQPSGAMVAQIRNAAQAVSKGAEWRGEWKVTPAWTVKGEVGLLDARFTDFPNGNGQGENFAGNRLPDAPRFNASVVVNHTHATEWGTVVVGVEQTHRSSLYSLPTNLPEEKIPSVNLTNLSVAILAQQGWSFGGRVDNVFDTDKAVYANKDFFDNRVVQYSTPRTFSLFVEKAF